MVLTYTYTDAYIYPGAITLDCNKQLIAILERNAQYTTITAYNE